MFWKRIQLCSAVLLIGLFQVATADDSPTQEKGLSETERQYLLGESRPLLRNECFRLFEKYLDDDGQKSFFYTIDREGRYACGKSAKQASRGTADDGALAACLRDKSRRGARMPKLTCRMYARENELLLSQADFGLEIAPAEEQSLSPEAYRSLIEAAEAVLGVKCLAEFKLYVRSHGHKSFYYAMDKKGRYACGTADEAIAASTAQNVALKHCDTHRIKEKVQAACRPYASGDEIVGKFEDFGIVPGLEDFQQALSKGLLSKVRKYVGEGLDINSELEDGMTPLMSAAEAGSKAVVAYLLSKGADMQAKNKEGKTAYDLAKDPEIKALLQ